MQYWHSLVPHGRMEGGNYEILLDAILCAMKFSTDKSFDSHGKLSDHVLRLSK